MTNLVLFNEEPKYTLSEFEFLQDPMDRNSKLGVGSFASVKLAREKKTGTLFALKMVRLHNNNKQLNSEIYNIKCEIFIHRKLEHPNIIKFHDYIQQDSNIYLILDYAENGNLYTFIHKKKKLKETEIFRYFYQSCLAVQYLHQNDIFHRDIKPENLLLDANFDLKLCDFGWATQRIQDKRTTFCGTYEYMAPEIVYKRPYDYRVDIWSLGILLYELIHRESPYKGRSLPEICKSLSRGTIKFSSNCHPEAQDLIQSILKHNPAERLSLTQILSHPWVLSQLSKEENMIVRPCGPQTRTLLHSHSLPLNVAETPERISKESYDAQTTTNAQSKGHNYDTWSEYFVTDRHNSNPHHKHMKSQHEINKSYIDYTDVSPKRVLQTSRSNMNLHLDTKQIQPIEGRLAFPETNRTKSPSTSSSSNAWGNQTPLNNLHTPKKASGDKKGFFQTNIFSPSFKTKLTSIISQLSVQTPTCQPAPRLEREMSTQTLNHQTPQNSSFTHNVQSASSYYQASSFCLDDKDPISRKESVSYKSEDKVKSQVEKDNYSQTKLQGRSPQVLDHMKNTFKEKLCLPKGDDLPIEPSSNSTTRTNTSDISHGPEIKSPLQKGSREGLNRGILLFNNEKDPIAPLTQRNNNERQENIRAKQRERFQTGNKKSTELKNILGANVVRYQIPIPMSTTCRQGRGKENFLGN